MPFCCILLHLDAFSACMRLAVLLPDATEGVRKLQSPMRFAGACVAMVLAIVCILASLGDESTAADASAPQSTEAVSTLQ